MMKDIVNNVFGAFRKPLLNECIILVEYRLKFKPPINCYVDSDREVIPCRENSANRQKQH